MGLADTAELAVKLSLTGNFIGQLKKAESGIGRLDTKLRGSSDRWYKAGTQIGTGIRSGVIIAGAAIGVLATQIGAGLRQLAELESLGAQTAAVIKSTGGAAGISANQVRNLAEKYESLNATIDDKVIQNSENLLLTFTNVRKEAFEPTLRAILDMNQALGGGEEGLQNVTIQVGKAMQDPIRGLTALRRVGVAFTDDQQDQIKALVKSGRLFEAQQVILAELNKEFGGSFLAGGTTTTARIAKFRDSIEDLQKALATALLPTVGKIADKLSTFLAKPETIAGVTKLGEQIAGLFSDKNIANAGQFLGEAFATVQSVLPTLKDAAIVSGQVLSTAVGLFKSLPPELQKLAIGALAVNKLTGGLVTNLAGGLLQVALKSLQTITAANVTVIGANVTTPGSALGTAAGAAGGTGALAGAAAVAGLAAAAAGLLGVAYLINPTDPNKKRTPEMDRAHLLGQGWTPPPKNVSTVPKQPSPIGYMTAATAAIVRAGMDQRIAIDRVRHAITARQVANVTVNVSTHVSAGKVKESIKTRTTWTSGNAANRLGVQ